MTSDAMWERSPASDLFVNQLRLVDSSPQQPFGQTIPCPEPYNELSRLDYNLHSLVSKVVVTLDHLGSPSEDPEGNAIKKLEGGMKEITKTLSHICTITCPTDEDKKLRNAMIERYECILTGMEQATSTVRARKIP